MDDRIRYAVILVVTVVWFANQAARFAIDAWEPSIAVDGLMGMIAGYLFLSAPRRGGGGDG